MNHTELEIAESHLAHSRFKAGQARRLLEAAERRVQTVKDEIQRLKQGITVIKITQNNS